MRALGALSDEDLAPLHEAAARGRADYAKTFLAAIASGRIWVRSPGERRSSTANTIIRDPAWRRKRTRSAPCV